MTYTPPASNLILVLGAFKRSGTNYLRDLLCHHDECWASPIAEDFLLAESDTLLRYIQATTLRWGMAGKPKQNLLMESMTDALAGLLNSEFDAKDELPETRIVSKTPSTEGIHNLDTIFPGAKVVFIVRDGRDTIESGRRSWDWGIQQKSKEWAEGVARIRDFEMANPGRSIRVRYEDLFLDLEATLTPVLQHCDLEPEKYDWEEARKTPIRGSSDLRHRFKERMHWSAKEPWPEFNPIGRWREVWTEKDKQDFEDEAALMNQWLGYT